MVDFDFWLSEAQLIAGYQANDVALSRQLFQKARLSPEEEKHVKWQVQNDLRRFQEIRRHILRMPNDHNAEVFWNEGVPMDRAAWIRAGTSALEGRLLGSGRPQSSRSPTTQRASRARHPLGSRARWLQWMPS